MIEMLITPGNLTAELLKGFFHSESPSSRQTASIAADGAVEVTDDEGRFFVFAEDREIVLLACFLLDGKTSRRQNLALANAINGHISARATSCYIAATNSPMLIVQRCVQVRSSGLLRRELSAIAGRFSVYRHKIAKNDYAEYSYLAAPEE